VIGPRARQDACDRCAGGSESSGWVIPALSKSTEVDDGGSTAGGTGVVFDWFGHVKYKEGPPSVLHLQDYWSWTDRGNFGGIFSPSFSISCTKTRGEILYGVLWAPSQCLAIASRATPLNLSVEITRLTLISFWHCTLLQRGRSVETVTGVTGMALSAGFDNCPRG